MLKFTFFALFLQIGAGVLLPLWFIPREEIGPGFFRFMSWLAAGMLAMAYLARPLAGPAVLEGASGRVALVLLLAAMVLLFAGGAMIQRWGKSYLFPAFVLALVAVVLIAQRQPVVHGMPPATWLAAASSAGSALVLGVVLCAMITGHWYLVNRRLTLQPLRLATLMFLAAMLLRFAFVTLLLPLTVYFGSEVTAAAARGLLGLSAQGLLFWTRFAVGLVGPLVFGFMIYATVKLRSTQSATGMLYATVVMVFIGEAFARFLWFFTGIPV